MTYPSERISVRLAHGMKRYGVIFLLIFIALGASLTREVRAEAPLLIPDSLQGDRSEARASHARTPQQEKLWPHQKLFRTLFNPVIGLFEPEETRQDLGFYNFFSYGWTQGWAEPDEGPEDAPRFRLLRIQRAFWEREVRLTYNYTFGADNGGADEQEGEFELELPINRRFLIEFEGAFVGVRSGGEPWKGRGSDLKIIPEVMLAETHDLSFSSGLVVRTPTGSEAVGGGRTSLTPYLAFWKDLGNRIGVHTYLGTEFPLDGFESGAPDALLQYGFAPTITVTPKNTRYLGNLTFFVETNGETNLGSGNDQTTVTLLPGARWLVFKDVWLAAGYEFPVTGTSELDSRSWLSLYLDF